MPSSRFPSAITRAECVAAGLAPLDLRIDSAAAGLHAEAFMEDGIYVSLWGPPGGPVGLDVSDCSDRPDDVEGAIRRRFEKQRITPLRLLGTDQLTIANVTRSGLRFAIGDGPAGESWFAAVLPHRAGAVLVGFCIPSRSDGGFSTVDVLANRRLAAALKTLTIE